METRIKTASPSARRDPDATWKRLQARAFHAACGAIGAIAPDVIILYSKRFSMSAFEFVTWQYVVATAVYVALGAFVAAIFPLKGRDTAWKAFGIGFCLPIVLGAVLATQRGTVIAPRGVITIPGTLLDLMSLF
jgi:hypothetical protein